MVGCMIDFHGREGNIEFVAQTKNTWTLHTIKSSGVSQITSTSFFWQFAVNCVVEFHDYNDVEDTSMCFAPE